VGFERDVFYSKVVNVVLLLFFPESEVLLEEFDDALGIAELVLLELVNLVEGVLEGLVGQCDGRLGVLHGLVVEHGEVKGEAELDGAAGGQGDVHGILVGLQGLVLDLLKFISLGGLSHVAVVISDHLNKEAFGLTIGGSLSQDVVLDEVDNFLAVLLKFLFNSSLVDLECFVEFCVLGVLLDGLDRAAGSTLGADQIFKGHREEVTLVSADVGTLFHKDSLKELNHVVETLCLFGNTG